MGSTIELLKKNLIDDKEFSWRLSMADVTTDGAFSNFSGYDRTLILIEGNGITLRVDSADIVLDQWLSSACFDGAAITMATLHNGPIKDFNIMTNQSHCSALVQCLDQVSEQRIQLSGSELLVYALDDTLLHCDENSEPIVVPGYHLFHATIDYEEFVYLRNTSAIVVQITYSNSFDQ